MKGKNGERTVNVSLVSYCKVTRKRGVAGAWQGKGKGKSKGKMYELRNTLLTFKGRKTLFLNFFYSVE